MAADLIAVDSNYETNTKVWCRTEALVEDLRFLMKDRDSCNVIFIVGNTKERFYAHTLILRARCAKFREWSDMPGCRSPACITEEHMKAEVFKKVLEYIYTGKVRIAGGVRVV